MYEVIVLLSILVWVIMIYICYVQVSQHLHLQRPSSANLWMCKVTFLGSMIGDYVHDVLSAVNSIADYNAAAAIQSNVRHHGRGRSRSRSIDWRSQQGLRRRHSADFSKKQRILTGLGRQSLDVCTPAP